MSSNIKKRKHTHRTSKFYLSTITAVLSVILALLLLRDPILLLYYFVSTFLVTAIAFRVRIRLFPIRTPKHPEKDLFQNEKNASTWRKMILMFFALLAFLFLPLFLVRVLDPYSWFILIISLTSGISIAEVLFYLYAQRYWGD